VTKLGRPHSNNPMTATFKFRTTKQDANRIEWLAKNYADGDLSEWLRYAAINAERKYLNKENQDANDNARVGRGKK
jgi:hypothetical protein